MIAGKKQLWVVGVTIIAAVAIAALIAWRDKGIDIPGIEDDAIPIVGQESRPPSRELSEEEEYLAATPIPAARSFKVGKLTPDAQRVPVLTDGGFCVGDKHGTIELIDRFDIEKSATAVTITMFVTQRRNVEICAGVGLDLVGRADLGEPLGNRLVLDGSKDPPKEPRRTSFKFSSRWDG